MKTVTSAVVDSKPAEYEEQHVHAVYDQIASHFSSTRYKVRRPSRDPYLASYPLRYQPWPIIANFLASLPTGWVGLDSGTGNGKYLHLPADRPGSILTIGMDRSWNLLQIAKHAGSEPPTLVTREVVWGDVLGNGWRAGAFVSLKQGFQVYSLNVFQGLCYIDRYDTPSSLPRTKKTCYSGRDGHRSKHRY